MGRARTTPQKATPEERTKRTIARLEGLAEELRRNIIYVKRPLVIEFSGTPKSGKTTTAHSLAMFLRRNHFKVRTIGESGSVSPLSNKCSLEFNVWTASSSLCWLLEALEKEKAGEFIVIDRGLFDALAWTQWHADNNRMTVQEKRAMVGYHTLKRFCKLIDIVFFMTARPEVALAREHTGLLTKKEGTIMNRSVLEGLIESFEKARRDYAKHFNRVEVIDSSGLREINCAARVVQATLRALNSAIVWRLPLVR